MFTIIGYGHAHISILSKRNFYFLHFLAVRDVHSITRNLGQDGGRVCYSIQNDVAFVFEIEWEVF